jgi:hypothetical protein
MTQPQLDMMREIENMCAFEKRGPTKEGERRAGDYIAGRMNDIGLEVNVEDFHVSPHYYWAYFAHMVLVLLAGFATIWTRPAWIPWVMAAVILLVAVSFWGDLTTKFHLLRSLMPRFPSRNIIGLIPNEDARRHVIVSAHYDAAKTGEMVFDPELDEKVAKFYKEKFDSTPNVMMPLLLAMVVMLGVVAVRAVVPYGTAMWAATWTLQGLASIALLIGAVSFFDIGIGPYVPGACDNLSGIASCMSIAEQVLAEPLENTDLTVLALGCEEAIMMGMVSYLRKHAREIDRENTYFINIESVGYGTVRYGVGEGFVRLRPYSKELVSIARGLKESGEFPEIGTYEVRLGTDAMVPLVRGFKAITIFAFNENNFVPNYHSVGDTPENMDIRVTERARDLAMRMLRDLDRTA